MTTAPDTPSPPKPLRILSLDGGGAKGFYTLGILDELEKNSGRPIWQSFDLIFGTSTGAIIAALLARGDSVEQAMALYREHVPTVTFSGKTMLSAGSPRIARPLSKAASKLWDNW